MVRDDCVATFGREFDVEASGLDDNVLEHAPESVVKKWPRRSVACFLMLGFVACAGAVTMWPQLYASPPDPVASAQAHNLPPHPTLRRAPTPRNSTQHNPTQLPPTPDLAESAHPAQLNPTQPNTTRPNTTRPNTPPPNPAQLNPAQLNPTQRAPTPRDPNADRKAPAERLTFEEFFAQLENRNQSRQELETSLVRYIELEHPTPILPDCPDLARQDLLDMGVLSSGKYVREAAPRNVSQGGPLCDSLFFSGPASNGNIIFDVILFSYELDILELRLHTLNRSVDKFVIAEFDVSHQGRKKPFIFGRNKNASRFQAFAAKIEHLPIREASSFVRDSLITDEKGIFKTEVTNTRASIAAFQDYVRKEYGAIDHNRLLYRFSHVDEIPHPSSLYKVKHCQVKNSVLPLGNVLWFVMSDLRYAFRSDYPAPHLPYTLITLNAVNLVFAVRAAKRVNLFPAVHNYLVGGWHMSGSVYPPFAAMKELTATESSREFDTRKEDFARFSAILPGRENRMVAIRSLVQTEHVVSPVFYEPPAYAQCNHDRYEIWYTRKDRRSALGINP